MSSVYARFLSILVVPFLAFQAGGQSADLNNNPVFDDRFLPDIHILIHPDSLTRILAPENAESDYEFPAMFVFQTPTFVDTVESVGFRLRGNTSRHSAKKSFKISFNTFERGRKFQGVEKLNLNGEHNDPSIIRSKLCWDIFKKMRVPSSRANHVRLFINGEFFGLYINVEHIDENFVQSRFGNNDGNLYKCLWPADLAYLGDNPELYKGRDGERPAYELMTNVPQDDYSDLTDFIINLNLTPEILFREVIEKIMEVNAFLRCLAVDVAVGSWDDYWYLKNNYYLYHNPETGKWHFIPYDYDNTFGIDWVGGDWGNRNVYGWGNSGEVRPLVTRILAIPEFRDRFSYYLSAVLASAFAPDSLFPRIDEIQARIAPFVESDHYRTLDYGYTVDDFSNSYDQALGGHVDYGLKPYVETRRNSAFAQLEVREIAPILEEVTWSPKIVQTGDGIRIAVRVEDDSGTPQVRIIYRFNGVAGDPIDMYEDGLHFDRAGADGWFGGFIPAPEARGKIEFYVNAIDAASNESNLPAGGSGDWIEVQVGYDVPGLYINEFMASNATWIEDNNGGYADWVEIYNGASEPIRLGDKFLTDDFANPDKWAFPDTTLAPGNVLLIWADSDPEQGVLHTTFRLDADGEQLGLFWRGDGVFLPVDTLTFGPQRTDISFGRECDGGSVWRFFEEPTPGVRNETTVIEVDNNVELPRTFRLHQNYPNPFNPATMIVYSLPKPGFVSLKVHDMLGREIRTLAHEPKTADTYSVVFDATGMASGIYCYTLKMDGVFVATRTMVLLR